MDNKKLYGRRNKQINDFLKITTSFLTDINKDFRISNFKHRKEKNNKWSYRASDIIFAIEIGEA